MEYKTLSIAQKEELILYELSKSVEYFITRIDETIDKYKLLNIMTYIIKLYFQKKI